MDTGHHPTQMRPLQGVGAFAHDRAVETGLIFSTCALIRYRIRSCLTDIAVDVTQPRYYVTRNYCCDDPVRRTKDRARKLPSIIRLIARVFSDVLFIYNIKLVGVRSIGIPAADPGGDVEVNIWRNNNHPAGRAPFGGKRKSPFFMLYAWYSRYYSVVLSCHAECGYRGKWPYLTLTSKRDQAYVQQEMGPQSNTMKEWSHRSVGARFSGHRQTKKY